MMDQKDTVLFVDDEPSILKALRRLFRREGYNILLAPGGEDGLQLLEEHDEISLIVSDQRMPDMVGAELLARAREISPHTQRILLTGYSDLESAARAVNEGGITRYLTKPWNHDELKNVVRDAVMRYSLEKRNRELAAELQHKNCELEQFNAQLETKVRERTRELQYKVKELEGKDRIAQHMLSVHSLEETLELVLRIISDLLGIDQIIVHLIKDGSVVTAAALGYPAPGVLASASELKTIERTPLHDKVFSQVEQQMNSANIKSVPEPSIPPFAVVPIVGNDELLGYIEVANSQRQTPISSAEVHAISSFALHTAIAISDAQVHQDFDSWKGKLDAVLDEVSEEKEEK